MSSVLLMMFNIKYLMLDFTVIYAIQYRDYGYKK